jgi:hypothetical protein
MSTPTEVQIAVETALSRVACELEAIAAAVERLQSLVALIASAAVATK